MPSRAGRPLATCRCSCDGVFQGTSLTDDAGRRLRGRSLSCPPGTRCRFFPGMNRENEVGPRQPRQARLWLHGDGPREPPRKHHSSWRQDTHSAAVKALGPPPPVTNRRETLTLLPDVSVKAKPRPRPPTAESGRDAAARRPAAASYLGSLLLLLPLLVLGLHQPLFGQQQLLTQHVGLVLRLRQSTTGSREGKEGKEGSALSPLPSRSGSSASTSRPLPS